MEITLIISIAFNVMLIWFWIAMSDKSEYNKNGWENTAYLFDDEKRKSAHLQQQLDEMIKIANQNALEAEIAINKLKKYGLDDL